MNNITIGIKNYTRTKHQLFFQFYANDWQFTTSYWYENVDLIELENQFGLENMENIYFHIAAYELNKLGSLGAEFVEAGPFEKFVTANFENVWKEIFHKVWAQWRYENDLPNFEPPKWKDTIEKSNFPIPNKIGETEILAFCGGGKDSLVGAKILEKSGIPFCTLGYAHSIYGTANFQHDLIQKLVRHTSSKQHFRQWIFEDFMDSPILELNKELTIKTLTAAETPSSIFGSLPILLQHGFKYLVLAHEKSADKGNLNWEKTGEDVNHQWGKSYEAEVLINSYIQKNLIRNFQYFSILKPVQDVFIFNTLKHFQEAILDTHSCNIRKPWCCRCPKCAYVLLNYYAYLPIDLVNKIIPEKDLNIFDLEENQLAFRQMLGLENQTPFECIGQIEEARLAFEMCRRKGFKGKAMEMFINECPKENWEELYQDFTKIYLQNSGIPQEILDGVLPTMARLV